MARIKMYIFNVKLPFYPPCEVKYGLQNRVSTADKSFVFFSHNTPNELKNEVLEILGPMQDQRHRKYLGLPSIIGKSKKEVFAEVREGGEKIIGVEGKDVVQWWKGNSNQGYGPGHTNMYYELLLAS